MGLRIVKRLAFVLAASVAVATSPAIGQALANHGSDFVQAVKERDGDKAMQALSGHSQGLVDTKDGEGNTGLIIAINRHDEEWTGFLLKQGADPNLAGKGGDTPLIAATRVGFGDAMEWLVSLGAKVNATNRMGETPLIIAVQQRNLSAVRFLLDHGADPDKTDSAAGYSARDYAQRDQRAREILSLINTKKPKAGVGAK